MDQPAQLLLSRRQGWREQRRQLEVRRLSSECAPEDRLEERHHDEARRYHYGFRLARTRRNELGAFTRGHFLKRQEAVLRTSCGHRRRWKGASRGGAIMRGYLVPASILVASIAP